MCGIAGIFGSGDAGARRRHARGARAPRSRRRRPRDRRQGDARSSPARDPRSDAVRRQPFVAPGGATSPRSSTASSTTRGASARRSSRAAIASTAGPTPRSSFRSGSRKGRRWCTISTVRSRSRSPTRGRARSSSPVTASARSRFSGRAKTTRSSSRPRLGSLARAIGAPRRRGAVLDASCAWATFPRPRRLSRESGLSRRDPPCSSRMARSPSARGGSPPLEDRTTSITESAAADLVREQLRAAVARRLASERPLGILLSGGLDSAAVLMLANETAGSPLPAFTLGFDDPSVDEAPFARAVAALSAARTRFSTSTADPAPPARRDLEDRRAPRGPSLIAWASSAAARRSTRSCS